MPVLCGRERTGPDRACTAARPFTLVAVVASGGFSVSIGDVTATASAFGRVHEGVARSRGAASGALARTAAMAGDDGVLAAWRNRYDAVARAAWAAGGAVSATTHDIATRLTATGDGYLAADHTATPDARGSPERLPQPRPRSADPAGPPGATGHTGGEAPGVRAEYWPGGDPAILRRAATAWNALAESLDDAAYSADSAFRTLTAHNTGETFSAMRTYWASRFTPCAADPLFNAAPAGARALGQSCTALADLIDGTRATIEHAAEDAAREVAPLEVMGAIPHPAGRAAALIARLSEPMMAHAFLLMARRDYLAELEELTAGLSPELEQRLDRAAQQAGPSGVAGALTAADVGEVTALGLRGSGWDGVRADHPTPDGVHVTPERVRHILSGDDPTYPGGGHRSGAGLPRKTEFPPGWSDSSIIEAVRSAARDPGVDPPPHFQGNDRWLLRAVRKGIEIEVVVDPDGNIVTGYPISGDGVVKNPGRRQGGG